MPTVIAVQVETGLLRLPSYEQQEIMIKPQYKMKLGHLKKKYNKKRSFNVITKSRKNTNSITTFIQKNGQTAFKTNGGHQQNQLKQVIIDFTRKSKLTLPKYAKQIFEVDSILKKTQMEM